MNIERLRILAKKLRDPATENHWAYQYILHSSDGNLNSCGSCGCAIGLTSTIPEFNLTIVPMKGIIHAGELWAIGDGAPLNPERLYGHPLDISMDTMCRLFELTKRQARRIFIEVGQAVIPMKDVTPKMVADEIDKLIEEEG